MTEPAQPRLLPSAQDLALGERLFKIFMPAAAEHQLGYFKKRPDQTSAQLVHYTSAEAALKIIKNKRLWMRNTQCMVDFREVQHGFAIYQSFFDDAEKRKRFTDALDACHAHVAQEAIDKFNQAWHQTVQVETYISCLSEHLETENVDGRLSMWRSSTSSAPRVAIVLNVPSDSLATLALSITFSPVEYLSEVAGHDVIEGVIKNVQDHCVFLQSVNREMLVQVVFRMLLAGVVCLKHDGFREEREWRAIYQPKIWPSPLMKFSTEVIMGVPQIVYQLPMDGTVSDQIADLEFAKMFDHLIIGPTQYMWPMYEAFADALSNAGVPDAVKRIVPSLIPLRP